VKNRFRPAWMPERHATAFAALAMTAKFNCQDGQRWDRTADAGLQGRLASQLTGLESANIIETISVVASSI
jgi:hypothetical protein